MLIASGKVEDSAGLVGLAARGALYLALAVLALDLVLGNRGQDADPRGAMHDLAQNGFGIFVLAILCIGFAAFALIHLYRAIADPAHETSQRVNDAFWAVVNGLLSVLAASFLFSPSKSGGDSDQTDKTLTAKVMDTSGGRLLVGLVGLAILGYGLYLLWRALSNDRQDERAVLEAAPHETPAIRTLATSRQCRTRRGTHPHRRVGARSPRSSTIPTRPKGSTGRSSASSTTGGAPSQWL